MLRAVAAETANVARYTAAMKLELSADERRALRADAHHLAPVVMIGNEGLSAAVLHEIDVNLGSHGLIKIRVFSDDRDEREALLGRIAEELDAAAVQHIGKLLVVYRPLPEPEKKAARRRRDAPEQRTRGGSRPRGQPSAGSHQSQSSYRTRTAAVAETGGPRSLGARPPRASTKRKPSATTDASAPRGARRPPVIGQNTRRGSTTAE